MSFSAPAPPLPPLTRWWTRAGALAIDLLITSSIELALLLLVWAASGSPALTLGHAETLLFEVGLPVAVLYAPLLLARPGVHNGQTIGKQTMGIRVIREDGRPLTFATALVREALGRQVPALLTSGLYVPVDYLWPLSDARNQALHDKIGRTFVVIATESESAAAASEAWMDRGAGDTIAREETVRGEWLPPVAPSRDAAD